MSCHIDEREKYVIPFIFSTFCTVIVISCVKASKHCNPKTHTHTHSMQKVNAINKSINVFWTSADHDCCKYGGFAKQVEYREDEKKNTKPLISGIGGVEIESDFISNYTVMCLVLKALNH